MSWFVLVPWLSFCEPMLGISAGRSEPLAQPSPDWHKSCFTSLVQASYCPKRGGNERGGGKGRPESRGDGKRLPLHRVAKPQFNGDIVMSLIGITSGAAHAVLQSATFQNHSPKKATGLVSDPSAAANARDLSGRGNHEHRGERRHWGCRNRHGDGRRNLGDHIGCHCRRWASGQQLLAHPVSNLAAGRFGVRSNGDCECFIRRRDRRIERSYGGLRQRQSIHRQPRVILADPDPTTRVVRRHDAGNGKLERELRQSRQ